MKNFNGKLAVITGGGAGIGRAVSEKLASLGCSLAICDISLENLNDTKRACDLVAKNGALVSIHVCDVSKEDQVNEFRDEVMGSHDTTHIDLLFNNAGVGGTLSFIKDDRDNWERIFNICWYGVYYSSRAFVPLLENSQEGRVINTCSVNGFWAKSMLPNVPNTAYSTAKFAVKGFSEALLTDFKANAPHVKVSVVFPGHVGTSFLENSNKMLGISSPQDYTDTEVNRARSRIESVGIDTAGMNDQDIKNIAQQRLDQFVNNAPVTPNEAADIILEGIKKDKWRILVGDDAEELDNLVRMHPEKIYDMDVGDPLS